MLIYCFLTILPSIFTILVESYIAQTQYDMNSTATLDSAIALAEIGLISWYFIAGHYEERPSDFDFIYKRGEYLEAKWRASISDLTDTFVFATWPFMLVAQLSFSIVEFMMFLPLVVAFILLHVIAAVCYWWFVPIYLRPVRLTIAWAQVSWAVAAIVLDGAMHSLSIIRAYVKAKQPEIQYAMRQFVTREPLRIRLRDERESRTEEYSLSFTPFAGLIHFQQDRVGRAHVVGQSLKKAMAPEVDLIHAGLGLVQKYVKLRLSEFKTLVNQLMTPEPLAEHYQKLVEAEFKRSLQQYMTSERMSAILQYVQVVLLAIKRAIREAWSALIKLSAI